MATILLFTSTVTTSFTSDADRMSCRYPLTNMASQAVGLSVGGRLSGLLNINMSLTSPLPWAMRLYTNTHTCSLSHSHTLTHSLSNTHTQTQRSHTLVHHHAVLHRNQCSPGQRRSGLPIRRGRAPDIHPLLRPLQHRPMLRN